MRFHINWCKSPDSVFNPQLSVENSAALDGKLDNLLVFVLNVVVVVVVGGGLVHSGLTFDGRRRSYISIFPLTIRLSMTTGFSLLFNLYLMIGTQGNSH